MCHLFARRKRIEIIKKTIKMAIGGAKKFDLASADNLSDSRIQQPKVPEFMLPGNDQDKALEDCVKQVEADDEAHAEDSRE